MRYSRKYRKIQKEIQLSAAHLTPGTNWPLKCVDCPPGNLASGPCSWETWIIFQCNPIQSNTVQSVQYNITQLIGWWKMRLTRLFNVHPEDQANRFGWCTFSYSHWKPCLEYSSMKCVAIRIFMLQSKYFCCKPKIFLHPKFSEQLGPLPWWQARRSEKSGWSLSSIISILSWSLILETRRIIWQVSWKKLNLTKRPFFHGPAVYYPRANDPFPCVAKYQTLMHFEGTLRLCGPMAP